MAEQHTIAWRCEVCGRLRSDDEIAVHTRDLGERWKLPPGHAFRNVKYCLEDLNCDEAAKLIADRAAQPYESDTHV